MRHVVVDTNCLLRMIHFNVLKDIPFLKVNVITLEQFQNNLQSDNNE